MLRPRSLVFLWFMILALAAGSLGQVVVSVSFGPPVLPVYVQPFCPGPGYIWAPGYWAWGDDDYYWVPGTWVLAPQPGFLWTPGYWGFSGGLYIWHVGYWGPQVGFYGGINYGFGYPGDGYYGGYWRGRDFYYNRAVNNVNITNVRVYNQTVVNNTSVNRVAYSGGPGGVQARPTTAQLTAARERRVAATPTQLQHQQAARADRTQFASANQGRPAVMATPRPGAFTARGATRGSLPPAPHQTAQGQHPNNAGNQPGVHQPPQGQHPTNAGNQPGVHQTAQGQHPTRESAAGNQPGVHQPPQAQHPNNANGNRPAPQPPAQSRNQTAASGNARVHTAPPPRSPAENRAPSPQQSGQMHNVPRPATPQHTAPQQEARQPVNQPRPMPEQHANQGHPVAAPSMNQHPMSAPHQAAPTHENAPRPPEPRGREGERPH